MEIPKKDCSVRVLYFSSDSLSSLSSEVILNNHFIFVKIITILISSITIFILCFLAFTSYKAFHTPLGYALMALGISEPTAFFLSLFIVALFPLFTGLVLGMKIIHALRINDYFSDDTYYSSGLSVVDKVFGAGYMFTLFLIVYSLFISES